MRIRTAERPPVIHTARLALRPFIAEDEDAMIGILMDNTVAITYMLPDFQSREEAARLFERLLMLCGQPEHFIYGMYRGDTLVGFLNDVKITEDAIEIGYVVAPEHQRKGYATEASKALIQWAYETQGARNFTAAHATANVASGNVIRKCGFQFVKYGQYSRYDGSETFEASFYRMKMK